MKIYIHIYSRIKIYIHFIEVIFFYSGVLLAEQSTRALYESMDSAPLDCKGSLVLSHQRLLICSAAYCLWVNELNELI